MTPTLGDVFPRAERERYCEEKIRPGAVFRLQSEDTNPPKIKIFVILAINESLSSVGILYINSQINIGMFRTPSIRALHLNLCTSDYSFLDHDSFLDCSHLYDKSSNELKDECIENVQSYLGQIVDTKLMSIKSVASAAPTIERKKKIIYDLI